MFGSFGYNWLKNGRILNPSAEPELVEDLFPAGSRIVIQSARASATYTCIITSTAGATRKDSTVTVLVSKGNSRFLLCIAHHSCKCFNMINLFLIYKTDLGYSAYFKYTP